MRLFFLCLALPLLSACSHAHSGVDSDGIAQGATVKVSSHHFLDINMYVVKDGQRLRLGTVRGTGTETFRIPASFLRTGGTLRFIADPIGSSETVFDQSYDLLPGDEIFVIVPSN